jgi:hypothetical protein
MQQTINKDCRWPGFAPAPAALPTRAAAAALEARVWGQG